MIAGTITRSVSMLAAFALLPSAFAAGVSVEKLETENEAVQLIRQVEEVARDVRYNAGRLNSFTTGVLVTKWTHYHDLEQIKSLVNDGLRPALVRLSEIQQELPEWKQQSIDKMIEAAWTLAADTEDAILTKQDTATVRPPLNAAYKGLVLRIHEHSETLVRTSDAAGRYAAARLKAAEAGMKVPHK